MPELPEVETVKKYLISFLENKKIINIFNYNENILSNSDKDNIISKIIKKIDRKGKYLIISLDKGYFTSHLAMEGKFFKIDKNDYSLQKHYEVVFEFDDFYLIYHDTRKFGKMKYFDDYDNLIKKINLGPDANSKDIDIDNLYKKLRKKNINIKNVLTDQKFIAGIGNIYVDEILYITKTHPYSIAASIDIKKFNEMIDTAKIILDESIKNNGTTIKSFSVNHIKGNNSSNLKIYGMQNCPEGHKSIKTKITGRGTTYCPICQFQKPVNIAVTGIIGSGKTEILNILDSFGFKVYSCDNFVKELYLDEEFMINVKNIIGINNKDEIKDIIFNQKDKKEKLENLIHPLVSDWLKTIIKNNKENIIFYEVPLLFQANMQDMFDDILFVKSKKDVLVDRIKKRDNLSYELIDKIMFCQLDEDDSREKRCKYIIENNGTINKLKKDIMFIIDEIIKGELI